MRTHITHNTGTPSGPRSTTSRPSHGSSLGKHLAGAYTAVGRHHWPDARRSTHGIDGCGHAPPRMAAADKRGRHSELQQAGRCRCGGAAALAATSLPPRYYISTISLPSRCHLAAISEVVRLDLPSQVPRRAREEKDVHRREWVVDGCDHQAVAREDGTGESELRE